MKHRRKRPNRRERPCWELRLYVADTNPRSEVAMKNLARLCQQHLEEPYRVTIIDIVRKPEKAREYNILATPTLVRLLPGPEKRVVGTLTDTNQVLRALEVSDEVDEVAAWLTHGMGQMGHA